MNSSRIRFKRAPFSPPIAAGTAVTRCTSQIASFTSRIAAVNDANLVQEPNSARI